MSTTPTSVNASWSFDTRPNGGKYNYVAKFQDYTSFTITAASYGTQGGAKLSLDLHTAPYGDLVSAARQAKVVATCLLRSTAATELNDYIFTGYLDKCELNFGSDDLVVHLRDSSAALMESTVQSRSFLQTPISDFISELTLAVNLQPDVIAEVAQNVGYFFNETTGVAAHRYSAWELIQKLATETENVAFCTPSGLFYFGPRERLDIKPSVLHWSYNDPTNDFLSLEVEVATLRNSIFFVIVQGHTPHNGANVVGTAVYVNDVIASSLGIGPGIYEGLTLAQAQKIFGDDLQVYNFNDEGLTAKGVQSKATSRALDIQGHEFVVKAAVLGTSKYRDQKSVV